MLITDPSRVISTHLAAIEGEAKLPTEGPFQDALPIWVEVNGGGFFVTPVYLTCGIGLHGENDEKLKRWAALVKTFPGPWCFAGDWNCPPELIASSPFMTAIGGEIVTPTNVAATCSSGKGSLIDYLVVNKEFKCMLRSCEAITPSWKPHLALIFTVARVNGPIEIRTLKSPWSPSLPKVPRKELDMGGKKEASLWRAAASSRSRLAPSSYEWVPRQVKRCVPYALWPDEVERLGRLFEVLITQAEIYVSAVHGEGRPEDMHKYVGRGQGPSLAITCRKFSSKRKPVEHAAQPLVRW